MVIIIKYLYCSFRCLIMMRISMSLPKKLLAEFDEVLKDRGYQSRSKGIRDALSSQVLWKALQTSSMISERKSMQACTFT